MFLPMDTPFSTMAPAKLYAFFLKLRPIQYGTLMPFSGELVHAAWLDWLKSAAPDVATWLHEGNKRRVFTCSSLLFPVAEARMRTAEIGNVHLPVEPEKIYSVRITLLLGELFTLFHEALMQFNMHEGKEGHSRKPPFMQLGKQTFLLEEVVIGQNDLSRWSGFTSFVELVEAAKNLRLNKTTSLSLEFASLTTFNRSTAKYGHGSYYARLPLPHYVFPFLAKRWQELAPPELRTIIELPRIEQYIQEDGILISNYDLKPHEVVFTTHTQPGFIGTCMYDVRGPDETPTMESPLTIRQQIFLLARFAFYCGVGYKTAMGMGRVRIVHDLDK